MQNLTTAFENLKSTSDFIFELSQTYQIMNNNLPFDVISGNFNSGYFTCQRQSLVDFTLRFGVDSFDPVSETLSTTFTIDCDLNLVLKCREI